MTTYKKFANKYFGQLKGYTITGFRLEEEYDLTFPVLIMKKGDRTIEVAVAKTKRVTEVVIYLYRSQYVK